MEGGALKRYIKRERPCLTKFPNTSGFSITTTLLVVFSPFFLMFGNAVKHVRSFVFDIIAACYWSWARCQIFLCLGRHTNEAKGQYNAELTLSPRLQVKPLITAIRAITWRCEHRPQQSDVIFGVILFSVRICGGFAMILKGCHVKVLIFGVELLIKRTYQI